MKHRGKKQKEASGGHRGPKIQMFKSPWTNTITFDGGAKRNGARTQVALSG
jgi:hypothetical protein